MIICGNLLEFEADDILESLEDFMELTKENMKVHVVKAGDMFEIHARQDIKYFERIAGFINGYICGRDSERI